ncbi:caspase-2-like [Lingula anatina]|uniref:Caspase-2-like n=1 Tax=Lingula anatina TaxID=7574 RepID=A0A2R2MSI1_LINAN|nr:caspase-2-like [Lingula anatina]|eukprot:XP_023932957.1 caspase-2-like [Lingula anatina]
MEPGPVADYLYQEGVLTYPVFERIKETRSRSEKVDTILDVVPRSGPEAFEHFYNALIVAGQQFLADLIWPDRVSQTHAETASRRSMHAQASQKRDDEDDDKLPENFPTPEIADFSVINSLKDVQDPELRDLLTNPKEPKGRAVIINNVKFDGDERRVGSDKDATRLELLFEKLKYNVVVHSNLTAEEMRGKLKEESENLENAAHHSFILIILSHGANGAVYGTDWKELSIPAITDIFNGNNCSFLVHKPKLFFIQACQGANVAKKSEDTEADFKFLEYLSKLEEVGNAVETDDSDVSVRAMADILIARTTVPGIGI